jgi:FtsH-binding integral membrane protein
MADWENSLAVRDGVFAQIFMLTLLALIAYRAWAAPYPRRKWLAQTAGLFLFVGLFIASVANIILWTP